MKKNFKRLPPRLKTIQGGYHFPFGRIDRFIMAVLYAKLFGAVLAYLASEISDLFETPPRTDKKKTRIVLNQIQLAIRNSKELDTVMKDVTIAAVGVRPYISSSS